LGADSPASRSCPVPHAAENARGRRAGIELSVCPNARRARRKFEPGGARASPGEIEKGRDACSISRQYPTYRADVTMERAGGVSREPPVLSATRKRRARRLWGSARGGAARIALHERTRVAASGIGLRRVEERLREHAVVGARYGKNTKRRRPQARARISSGSGGAAMASWKSVRTRKHGARRGAGGVARSGWVTRRRDPLDAHDSSKKST